MKKDYVPSWRVFRRLFSLVCVAVMLASITTPTNAAAQTVITGPAGSGEFGYEVGILPNGNIVISDPYYDSGDIEDVGAVYLYNGATLALISKLTGSAAGDSVGYNNGSYAIKVLENGNFLVISTNWSNGVVFKAGAVTWCSAVTGCNGEVSSANSLIGSHENDSNYGFYLYQLGNGNYVIVTQGWKNGFVPGAGAVTFCSQSTACVGEISPANSLVGTQTNDHVGWPSLQTLSNGNYVVISSSWSNGSATDAGAVTVCDGTIGCIGEITSTNSLVGTQSNDFVGSGGTLKLSNGNYVVKSPYWTNGSATKSGAVTFCNATAGCTGSVTVSNSLVGSAANDNVGYGVSRELSDGNYVVPSYSWTNGSALSAGAVTWCSGTTGCSGPVTSTNSLVGSTAGDMVGRVYLLSLPNGGYVFSSYSWSNGSLASAGAVTYCNQSGGCSGVVSSANSLVGSHADDKLGSSGLTVLSNGNYVAGSPGWDRGIITNAGAVTWCDGTIGCTGEITTTNSLVGSSASDSIGQFFQLANGNYVVRSNHWDNGVIVEAGAVTWCDGDTGCFGEINAANSLVGSTTDDTISYPSFRTLTTGDYVITSQYWDNGAIANVGAATWCDGDSGCSGVISSSNSLVGSAANDQVGSHSTVEIINGDYIVFSPFWANGGVTGAGAVTRCSGISGCTGVVTNTNSLVGSQTDDNVSMTEYLLADAGDYVIGSQNWDNGAITDAGAVTWCDADTGCVGPITSRSSVLGEAASSGAYINYIFDGANHHLIVGKPKENKVSIYFLSLTYLPIEVK